jgi:MtrB/PioB family decaheme-associated outer membrane protein
MGQCDMKGWLNSRRWWLVLLCLPSTPCFSANTLQTELPAGVDVSHWNCSYCAFEQGYSGEIEAGVGYVSDDSFKFGEYNGLYDKGGFLIGNAALRYRNKDASYLDLQARDLGLDSRSIDIQAGQQGKYDVFLNYHEISHYLFNTAKTPYRGNGSDVLQLPPGWLTAGSTAGMTGLANSLQGVELKTQRRQLSIGASYLPISHWETSVKFHHEVRDGQLATAGSFLFNSAQLVQPIDYVTNDAEVAVSYTAKVWQFRLAYYASFFDNHDSSLTWQNAYNPIVAGADKGQLALPPSNQFHQVLFSSSYHFSKRTNISGDFAVGRMEQDEQLLAATVNPGLVVALPEASANARVDTLTANLRINSRVNNKLRLTAAYRYNDRDNKTPSYLFNWVTTDAFATIARRNLPYSFTDKNLNLGGDYRFGKRYRLSVGYKNADKLRTHQEVDRTTEDTVWGKISVRMPKDIDVAFKGSHGERHASGFHLVSDTVPAQNPLLRKYNMSDRIRNSGSLQASFTFTEKLSVDVNIDYSHDNYSKSALGLTESHDVSYNADAWLLLTNKTNLHAFAGRERIKSDQVGSQSFSIPDWFAKNDDTVDNLGFGVKHQLMLDKLALGADYMLLRSLGKICINTGSAGADFPDLKSNLSTLKLYADYRLQENMTLHAAYWYEHYHSTDWMVDNVDPATVSNVLGLGLDSPDYDVHTLMMTVRYRF